VTEGIWRTHRNNRDAKAVLVFEPQAFLKGVGVEGVHDERHAFFHEGPGLGVGLDLGGVGDLLHAGYDEHGKACPGKTIRQCGNHEGGSTERRGPIGTSSGVNWRIVKLMLTALSFVDGAQELKNFVAS
jgi:hypothetical protein